MNDEAKVSPIQAAAFLEAATRPLRQRIAELERMLYAAGPDHPEICIEATKALESRLKSRISELEAEVADYRGGSAWVHTWLIAEKFRKPDVPRIVEAAKRHYRKTLENSKALETAIKQHQTDTERSSGAEAEQAAIDQKLWEVCR